MTERPDHPFDGPEDRAHVGSAAAPVGGRASRRPGRRALRWLVPLVAVGVVATLASGVLSSAEASPDLPPSSASQLLAEVGSAKLAAFSVTVVEKASLGLPQLPDLGGDGADGGPLSLLAGSHTIRVWYGGPSKQRVALLSQLGEQDVFRNGTQLWTWDSTTRTASHATLPADAATPPVSPQTPGVTPDQAAEQVLALIGPSTALSTDGVRTVAGRAAYVLVLQPKDSRSLIGQVRIAVDGKTKIPLSVQVFARGGAHPAMDVSFTRFDQSAPSDANFAFTPPPGATTKQLGVGDSRASDGTVSPDVTVIGSGWTSVVKITGLPALAELESGGKQAGVLADALSPVSGPWGSGRLFSSTLLSGLITSDGTAYLGFVGPDLLYQAAESH